MKFLRHLVICAVASLAVMNASPAHAELYAKPSLANIMKTIVRFGAMDLADDQNIDSFARATECDLYTAFYHDDFKWKTARDKLRQKMAMDVAAYPTGYAYDTTLTFARYNFEEKYYPLEADLEKSRVNTFKVQTSVSEMCGASPSKANLPKTVKFYLQSPIQVKGIPLSEEEGKVLFDRMNAAGNTDHNVYVRLNIRVVFIASISNAPEDEASAKAKQKKGDEMKVRQRFDDNSIVIDSRLDSIEYFEDPERTKLIYIYRT